jgi:YD repeat-containing protein
MRFRWAWLRAILLVIGLGVGGSPARALVDMKNANLVSEWLDFTFADLGLRGERTYNSRSIYHGLFGFGWCSNWEDRAFAVGTRAIAIHSCGGGQETLYLPAGGRGHDADEVFAAATRKDRALIGNPTLRRELGGFGDTFNAWSAQLGYAQNTLPQGRFESGLGHILESTPAGLHHIDPSGEESWFDRGGRLIKKKTQAGVVFTIERDGTRWMIGTAAGSFEFLIEQGPKPHVLAVIRGGKTIATFTYSGDDLIAMRDGWGNAYAYEYTSLHNLRRISYPDGTEQRYDYNEDKDWVAGAWSRADPDGVICREEYTYRVGQEIDTDARRQAGVRRLLSALPGDGAASTATFHSVAVKKCGSHYKNYSTFFFEHGELQDGSSHLKTVLTITAVGTGDETRIVSYRPESGQPAYIQSDAEPPSAYSPAGQVRTVRDPVGVMTLRSQVGCGSFTPSDAWPALPGLPRRVTISVRYADGFADSRCKTESVTVDTDGRRDELRLERDGEAVTAIAAGERRWPLGKDALGEAFSWRPVCLGVPFRARGLRLASAIVEARRTGRCSPEEIAIAFVTLYAGQDAWYWNLPNQTRPRAQGEDTIPEDVIPPKLRLPDVSPAKRAPRS